MSRPSDPNKKRIIDALTSIGYSLSAARAIAYGSKKMNDLDKAKKLSKKPYYISIDIWEDIYNKSGT